MLECEACVGDHAGMEKLKKKNKEGAPYCFLNSLCFTAMSLNKHVDKLALIAIKHENFTILLKNVKKYMVLDSENAIVQ